MKKISGSTFYLKKLLPSLWFGFFALFLINFFVVEAVKDFKILLVWAIFIAIIAIFVFFIFKKLIWDLADEVYDEGDALLFRKGKQKQRVLLKDIIHINYTRFTPSERIILHISSNGPIRKKLVFNPPLKVNNPFSPHPIITELIKRVEHAKHT